MNYLDKINSPKDIKSLNCAELDKLAAEIREGIFNRDSKIGGHVGPNLGIVETTIAWHYVFDSPKDKLVFDVSHQSYPGQQAWTHCPDETPPAKHPPREQVARSQKLSSQSVFLPQQEFALQKP